VERAARHAGLPPESRRFSPHVTLAYVRGASALTLADYISAQLAFRLPPIPIGSFSLFSARSGSGGGPYVTEAEFPLGPGSQDYTDVWQEDDDDLGDASDNPLTPDDDASNNPHKS
jgi:LigT like Phosphoesterase